MAYALIILVIVALASLVSKRPPADPPSPVVCPNCSYDCRATPDRCPECGTLIPRRRRPLDPAKLRDHWPLAPIVPRTPGPDEVPVPIWDAPNTLAANLLVQQLRERGILATSRRAATPIQVGPSGTPAGYNSVNVWSEDVAAAEAIMDLLTLDSPQNHPQ